MDANEGSRPPKGSAPWLDDLAGRFLGHLARRARQRGVPAEDAIDVVHAGLVSAYERIKEAPVVEDERQKWFFKQMYRALRNHVRRESRARVVLFEDPEALARVAASEHDTVADPEDLELLDEALDSLKAEDRAAIISCELQDEPIAHAASVLGVSVESLKVRLHRARQKLAAEVLRRKRARRGRGVVVVPIGLAVFTALEKAALAAIHDCRASMALSPDAAVGPISIPKMPKTGSSAGFAFAAAGAMAFLMTIPDMRLAHGSNAERGTVTVEPSARVEPVAAAEPPVQAPASNTAAVPEKISKPLAAPTGPKAHTPPDSIALPFRARKDVERGNDDGAQEKIKEDCKARPNAPEKPARVSVETHIQGRAKNRAPGGAFLGGNAEKAN